MSRKCFSENAESNSDEPLYRICITNRHLIDGFDETNGSERFMTDEQKQAYFRQIKHALQQKPDALILREKDLAEQEYELLAGEIMKLCQQFQVECILNSYVHAAIRMEAKRIHLPMWRFRKLAEEERKHFQKIGVSVHSIEEAVEAEKCRADYVIAGHIFQTDCKRDVPPRGIEFLQNICQAVSIPVYAIGGIHDYNGLECIHAGAAGVCMMSEYMKL